MSTTTTNLGLIKPELTDNVSITDINENMDKIDAIADYIYPVGSIYMSANSTNPSTLFGGTWQSLAGRVIVGAGSVTDKNGHTATFTAGETDGELSHQLTVPEIANHTHTVAGCNSSESAGAFYKAFTGNGTGSILNASIGETRSVGDNGYHNNMQPYEVKYMWERTA